MSVVAVVLFGQSYVGYGDQQHLVVQLLHDVMSHYVA